MGEFQNPFDPSNFIEGGGLWDDKIVTITGSKFGLYHMKRGDGSAVVDNKTGEPVVKRVWEITGIADDDERERQERYSIGSLQPTADGESFTKPDGSFGTFHKNADAAKFASGLFNGGFDVNLLFDAETGKAKASALVGARIRFKAEAQLDKDGNPKKNKKGYEMQNFYPSEFIGFKDGVAAAAGPSDEDVTLAQDTVVAVLTALGGSASRGDVIREVTKKLAGTENGPKVIQLLVKPEFNAAAPWTLDGTTLSIPA